MNDTKLNIQDILDRPAAELAALSDEELTALLAPFFPACQTPVLPEMRKSGPKVTVSGQAVKTMLSEGMEMLAQLRAMRNET